MVLVQCTCFLWGIWDTVYSLGVVWTEARLLWRCFKAQAAVGVCLRTPLCAIRPDFLDVSLFSMHCRGETNRVEQQQQQQPASKHIASCPSLSHSPPSLFSFLHFLAFSLAEENSVMEIQGLSQRAERRKPPPPPPAAILPRCNVTLLTRGCQGSWRVAARRKKSFAFSKAYPQIIQTPWRETQIRRDGRSVTVLWCFSQMRKSTPMTSGQTVCAAGCLGRDAWRF